MATFEVKVLPVKIETHPNADSLEVARIGDFRAIVRKGDFGNGDHVAYIPEGAVVPADVLEEMGLTGRLAGPEKNRVKAVKLRGVLSQGLCYPARKGWRKGDDVAAELGIFKFEPVVPAGFSGELQLVGGKRTIHYDIENVKKYPDVFREGEQVVFTEKLHGTFAIMGVMGDALRLFDADTDESRLIVASKGIAAKGMSFKVNASANANNLYVRTAKQIDVMAAVERGFGKKHSVYLMGEIFGPGVQDLTYGMTQASFRIFDIYLGDPGEGRFLDDDELDAACQKMGITRVPVLYRGPFSQNAVNTWTNGKETISGAHVREGIVIRSRHERTGVEDLPCWGRAQLKSVSEGYLLRKGEVTEFA